MKLTLSKKRFLILIPLVIALMGSIRTSKEHATEVLISMIEMALYSFRLDIRRYPDTYEGLLALYEKPKGVNSDDWKGPYLKKHMPKDPWRQDFRYISPGVHNKESFDLFSIGRDGVEGTIDDINNWDESKAWVEHYQKLKSWYWNELLKSWYWYDLWNDSWVFRMSLLVSLVFGLFIGLFVTVLLALIRLIIKHKKNK
jgi:general secretion pathway protein G